MSGILTSTTFEIVGRQVSQHLDTVVGISVRIPTAGQALKSMFGGGQKGSMVKMCQDTRAEAFEQMIAQAKGLGADAVVGIRYDAAEINVAISEIPGTEVMCYGTAVKLA